ncbi:MAG: hypothetical protein C5B50_07050 [Verrucomicrobia bacterium]|nr:MAG: hypothetical protein C5B50_07050 [Verrucomicrobiota bacterium]
MAAHTGNHAVISGFQTPIEKECLAILLRGKSPVIICPARRLSKLRLPPEWKTAIAEGRPLILSPFRLNQHRATRENCDRRNQLVAALAHEVIIPYAAPAGRLEKLTAVVRKKSLVKISC